MKAEDIKKVLDYIIDTCDFVQDHDACEGCPFTYRCLLNEPIWQTEDDVSTDELSEWLEYALGGGAEAYVNENKSEWEIKADAESDYWNLKRSEIDYDDR